MWLTKRCPPSLSDNEWCICSLEFRGMVVLIYLKWYPFVVRHIASYTYDIYVCNDPIHHSWWILSLKLLFPTLLNQIPTQQQHTALRLKLIEPFRLIGRHFIMGMEIPGNRFLQSFWPNGSRLHRPLARYIQLWVYACAGDDSNVFPATDLKGNR